MLQSGAETQIELRDHSSIWVKNSAAQVQDSKQGGGLNRMWACSWRVRWVRTSALQANDSTSVSLGADGRTKKGADRARSSTASGSGARRCSVSTTRFYGKYRTWSDERFVVCRILSSFMAYNSGENGQSDKAAKRANLNASCRFRLRSVLIGNLLECCSAQKATSEKAH